VSDGETRAGAAHPTRCFLQRQSSVERGSERGSGGAMQTAAAADPSSISPRGFTRAMRTSMMPTMCTRTWTSAARFWRRSAQGVSYPSTWSIRRKLLLSSRPLSIPRIWVALHSVPRMSCKLHCSRRR
jgi:hypothetical protein